jgi:hypothetical protein
MKKKVYMKPEVATLDVETAEMIAFSGGSEDADIVINDEEPDYSDDDNRSREFWGGVWGDVLW